MTLKLQISEPSAKLHKSRSLCLQVWLRTSWRRWLGRESSRWKLRSLNMNQTLKAFSLKTLLSYDYMPKHALALALSCINIILTKKPTKRAQDTGPFTHFLTHHPGSLVFGWCRICHTSCRLWTWQQNPSHCGGPPISSTPLLLERRPRMRNGALTRNHQENPWEFEFGHVLALSTRGWVAPKIGP